MEYLDVLDENGLPTGQTLSRKDMHAQGLWHRAVLIAVVDKDNKILIQQRSANKEKYPNKWDISVAGHVSAGMDSLNTAYSEIMEEIGTVIPFDIKVKDFRYVTSFRDCRVVSENFIENQFYDLYVLKIDIPLSSLEIQLDEVQDVDYKTIFQINEMKKEGLFHPRDKWIELLYKYITRVF